jgi:hypothetical protein
VKVTINLNSVGAMRDLEHYFYDNADNENADVLHEAAKAQMALDIAEMEKNGRTPEERLLKLIQKERKP